jgi:hypothetical protein
VIVVVVAAAAVVAVDPQVAIAIAQAEVAVVVEAALLVSRDRALSLARPLTALARVAARTRTEMSRRSARRRA